MLEIKIERDELVSILEIKREFEKYKNKVLWDTGRLQLCVMADEYLVYFNNHVYVSPLNAFSEHALSKKMFRLTDNAEIILNGK